LDRIELTAFQKQQESQPAPDPLVEVKNGGQPLALQVDLPDLAAVQFGKGRANREVSARLIQTSLPPADGADERKAHAVLETAAQPERGSSGGWLRAYLEKWLRNPEKAPAATVKSGSPLDQLNGLVAGGMSSEDRDHE